MRNELVDRVDSKQFECLFVTVEIALTIHEHERITIMLEQVAILLLARLKLSLVLLSLCDVDQIADERGVSMPFRGCVRVLQHPADVPIPIAYPIGIWCEQRPFGVIHLMKCFRDPLDILFVNE